jgi:hypothetical protein
MEKQALVKEHVQREQIPEAQPDGPATVGMVVSEDFEL